MYPRKLKKMNLFQNGASFLTETKTVQLPKLARKTEGYRGGAMGAEVEHDVGYEMGTLEFTLGGLVPAAIAGWGSQNLYRFAGAYTDDGTGEVMALEAVISGLCKEVDFGDAEAAKDTEHKFQVSPRYYKLMINGATIVELDPLRGVEIVGGVDLSAQIRAAIGLS